MAKSIDWTPLMDHMVRALRDQGHTCHEVAACLGVSKNAVINRCDRLGLVTGPRFRRQKSLADALNAPSLSVAVNQWERGGTDDRERRPLPAGHAVTWQAITSEVWPGIDYIQARRNSRV